jgi:hypothetical protein
MIFRLANRSDDVQLRQLVRETIVPGHIRMAYTREPNFFKAYENSDEDTQVIVAESNEEIVGVACRSIRKLFVNGTPLAFGYLSGLRLKPSAQNTPTLARGYAFLKQLHEDERTPAYLTTIIEGNDKAKRILTSGRANLPSYKPIGGYLTHVVPVKIRSSKPNSDAHIQIKAATEVCGHELTSFLVEEGGKRQFFPVHNCNGQTSAIPRSIGLGKLLVAEKGNCIVGTMSVWDQDDCKQSVVAGYSGALRALRPVLNLFLGTRRLHPLPNIGQQLRYGTAAMICIKDNDPSVFTSLLKHTLALAAERGLHQFAVGMHERDPLVPALKGFFMYCTRVLCTLSHGKTMRPRKT